MVDFHVEVVSGQEEGVVNKEGGGEEGEEEEGDKRWN